MVMWGGHGHPISADGATPAEQAVRFGTKRTSPGALHMSASSRSPPLPQAQQACSHFSDVLLRHVVM